MTEIKKSILINAPVSKVFEFASNYQKWPEFFVGISDIRPITDITNDNGARFLYKVQMMGLKISVGTEFQQFKKNEGWIGQSFKGLDAQTQWIFSEAVGKTDFTYIQRYKMPFYMGGDFVDKKYIIPQWIKIIDISFQNLKRLIE
jgi:ribosome-associated toxin RatA of RatAB toxin-antitoxin module